jgi:hypothetical protein
LRRPKAQPYVLYTAIMTVEIEHGPLSRQLQKLAS